MSDDGARAPRVLVTGASVAGPAAAYWLDRVGYDVTVLERSPEPRRGGQNIDVRGLAKDVLERMDLLEAVRDAGTGEVGTRFVDEDGGAVAEFPTDADTGDGPTAELEILRGELARLLRERCPDSVTWWYGDHVVALDQDDERVSVTLESGAEHAFDLLVVAEGPGSATRGLVMTGADEPELDRLGMYCAWATIPRTEDDDRWWRWLSVPGSRSVNLRPDNQGTTRAMLNFMTDEEGLADRTDEEQRADLERRFGDVGWETPRILAALGDADDLYVHDLTQVKCPTWSRGRVVLTGDAAWCVTPIGGFGTSLALIGAYVLAAELKHAASHTEAFERYDAWLRPLVDDVQDLPPGTPRIANPRSRLGVALFRAGTRLAASAPARALAARLSSDAEDERTLPEL
ncbi:FAD-binding monooxygenase [Nocardioides anomalus]|uniref:FAD-binding monooxygenase n=1 Tax=Nocardioides anomalus TaxID=2712223 RepID=A0A6G6W8L3_9ACTN|nr:FAD-dependent monooxygenase [Nocardioides anomalus]QIG41678.1 FAD-binding monooxygenase [Nocardioides anomalus]